MRVLIKKKKNHVQYYAFRDSRVFFNVENDAVFHFLTASHNFLEWSRLLSTGCRGMQRWYHYSSSKTFVTFWDDLRLLTKKVTKNCDALSKNEKLHHSQRWKISQNHLSKCVIHYFLLHNVMIVEGADWKILKVVLFLISFLEFWNSCLPLYLWKNTILIFSVFFFKF
jgi:hypothetical protein